MDQIPHGLWVGPKGPNVGAEKYSLQQELEKASDTIKLSYV